ncbi:MAG TPA: hypothetical protein VK922_17340 [Gemmatimonadaceae bacterium]|nr:hypothetical protein [Gemmatimonadaceae bacterium]
MRFVIARPDSAVYLSRVHGPVRSGGTVHAARLRTFRMRFAVQVAADRDAAGTSPATAGRRLHKLSPCWQAVQMSEQTYDEKRARRLEEMLRALAERIRELDARGELLRHAGELTQHIGDVRSELFHYEVRATYDTPEVAESRKIVEKSKQTDTDWEQSEWAPDEDDEPTW